MLLLSLQFFHDRWFCSRCSKSKLMQLHMFSEESLTDSCTLGAVALVESSSLLLERALLLKPDVDTGIRICIRVSEVNPTPAIGPTACSCLKSRCLDFVQSAPHQQAFATAAENDCLPCLGKLSSYKCLSCMLLHIFVIAAQKPLLQLRCSAVQCSTKTMSSCNACCSDTTLSQTYGRHASQFTHQVTRVGTSFVTTVPLGQAFSASADCTQHSALSTQRSAYCLSQG